MFVIRLCSNNFLIGFEKLYLEIAVLCRGMVGSGGSIDIRSKSLTLTFNSESLSSQNFFDPITELSSKAPIPSRSVVRRSIL